MSKALHTHANLLAIQAASVFQCVIDHGFSRFDFRKFQTLEYENLDPLIKFEVVEHLKKGRVSVDVHLSAGQDSNSTTFVFRQWFNYGILLELEIGIIVDGTEQSFLSYISDAVAGDIDAKARVIDFEYVISVFTEQVAGNINRLKGD